MSQQEGIEENLKNKEVFKLIEVLTKEIEEAEMTKANPGKQDVEEIKTYLKLLNEVKTLALRAGVLNTLNLEASLKVWDSLKKVIQNKAGIEDFSKLEKKRISLLSLGFSAAIFIALFSSGSLNPITGIIGALATFLFGAGISYVYSTYLKTLSVETKKIRLESLKEEIIDSLTTIIARSHDTMINTASKLLAKPEEELNYNAEFKQQFLELTFRGVELLCTFEDVSKCFDEL